MISKTVKITFFSQFCADISTCYIEKWFCKSSWCLLYLLSWGWNVLLNCVLSLLLLGQCLAY